MSNLLVVDLKNVRNYILLMISIKTGKHKYHDILVYSVIKPIYIFVLTELRQYIYVLITIWIRILINKITSTTSLIIRSPERITG